MYLLKNLKEAIKYIEENLTNEMRTPHLVFNENLQWGFLVYRK